MEPEEDTLEYQMPRSQKRLALPSATFPPVSSHIPTIPVNLLRAGKSEEMRHEQRVSIVVMFLYIGAFENAFFFGGRILIAVRVHLETRTFERNKCYR